MKDYSMPIGVSLDEVDGKLRPASQMRAALNEEALAEYTAVLDSLPQVKLMADKGGHHWVVDGCHTVTAAKKAGRRTIQAIVKAGTYLEAFEEAAQCNQKHGVRLTDADKRHRIEIACKLPEMKNESNREIARLCGVSNHMVAKYRISNSDHIKNGSAPKIEVPQSGVNGDTSARRGSEQKVEGYFVEHPGAKQADAAKAIGLSQARVSQICRKLGLTQSAPRVGSKPDPPADPEPEAEQEVEPAFPFDDRWDAIEEYTYKQFASWPKEYHIIFVERLESLLYGLRSKTPEWKPSTIMEISS